MVISYEYLLQHFRVASAKAIIDKISSTASIKFVVVIESVDESVKTKAKEAGVSILDFQQLVEAGKADKSVELHPPKGEDLGIVCYTSGTTGNPKGVMITHANYCGTVAGLLKWAEPIKLTHEETHLSYLPLAHVLEQSVAFVVISLGGRVGFYQGWICCEKCRIHGYPSRVRVGSDKEGHCLGHLGLKSSNAEKGKKRTD